MAARRKAWDRCVAPEDAEQEALARWLDARGLLWCHCPNGGHRHIIVAARLRAAGVKPGVPDVLIFERPRAQPECIGVAIELKRNDSRCKPTVAQVAWLEALGARRWYTAVCHGSADAIRLLTGLGF